jgi:hemerythrin-like domain-containing protein
MSIAHHDGHDRRDGGAGAIGDDDPRAAIDPAAPALVAAPLDFFFAEHLRQRQLAKILTLIADGLINRRTIATVIAFIRTDLAQHILDEEISFFPFLRPLCHPEDNIDAILNLLAEEHRADESESETMIAILENMAKGGEPGDAARAGVRDFADRLRHHLALENGVLLPLARARMTSDALRLVAQSMAARRGGARS